MPNTQPPNFGTYQSEIYARALLHAARPIVTTDPNKLRSQAKKALRDEPYNYIAGGAGEGATMDANRLAFRQWKIVPRVMRQIAPRDLRVNLFGEEYAHPLLMAPVGVQRVFHEAKETGTARACAELSVPFILSTAATSTMQEISSASGSNPHWFQLYWPVDDELTISLLRTAKATGFKVLVITVDTACMSWRPGDLDSAWSPFMTGYGNSIGFADPVFRRNFAAQYNGAKPEDKMLEAAKYWLSEVLSGDGRPWEHLDLIKKHWDGPIVLKGVQDPEDAKLALKHGISGIIVSNHGGRQLDGSVASLDMLPEIVEAVGDKMTVLFDSGIRTGADIFKALALGAKAVLVGRPVIYGLSIDGKAGAKHVLASLLTDLDVTMGLAGIQRVKDLSPRILRKVSYGGDMKTSL